MKKVSIIFLIIFALVVAYIKLHKEPDIPPQNGMVTVGEGSTRHEVSIYSTELEVGPCGDITPLKYMKNLKDLKLISMLGFASVSDLTPNWRRSCGAGKVCSRPVPCSY